MTLGPQSKTLNLSFHKFTWTHHNSSTSITASASLSASLESPQSSDRVRPRIFLVKRSRKAHRYVNSKKVASKDLAIAWPMFLTKNKRVRLDRHVEHKR